MMKHIYIVEGGTGGGVNQGRSCMKIERLSSAGEAAQESFVAGLSSFYISVKGIVSTFRLIHKDAR